MAYIHCAKCDWQQDDFYSPPNIIVYPGPKRTGLSRLHFRWGYNPFSRLMGVIGWLWKPRILNMDGWIMGKNPGYQKIRIFSWKLFFYEVGKIYRSWKNMKWYTMTALKKDKNSKCPKCSLSGRGWWVVD